MAPKNKKSAVKKKNEKKNRQKAALAAKEALQRKNVSEPAVNEAKKTTEKATAVFSKEDKKKEKQRLKEKKEKEKREKWQIKRHAKIQKIKDKKKAAEAADKKKKTSPPAAKLEKDIKQKPVKEKKQEAQKAPNPEKKSEKSDAEKSTKDKLTTGRALAGAEEKNPPQHERTIKNEAALPAAEVKTEFPPVNEPAEKRVISNAGEIIPAAEDLKAVQETEDVAAVEADPSDEHAGDVFNAVPEKEELYEECPEKTEEQPEEITVIQETVIEEIISIEKETIALVDDWQEFDPIIDETDESTGLAGDGYSAPVINEPNIESELVIEEIFEYEEIQEEPAREGFPIPVINEPNNESEPVIEEISEYEELQEEHARDSFSAPVMDKTDDESSDVKSGADITAENPTDENGDVQSATIKEPADDKQDNNAWWTFTPIIEQEETIVANEPFETDNEINTEPVGEEFTAAEEEIGKSAEEEWNIIEEQAEPDGIKAAVPVAPGIINKFKEKEKAQKVKRQKSETGKKTFVFISGKLTEIRNKTKELPKRTKIMMLFAAVFIAVILVALITVSVINHTMPENSVPMYKGLTEESVNVRVINIELDEQLERAAATKVKGNTGEFKFFANNDLMINEWYDKIPLVLGNVESNKCDFLVTILDSSDTIVYRSMGIKPGYYLPSIRLFDTIPYGENDLTLVVAAYNPETYKNVGVQRMKLKLVIGFEQTTEQVTEQTTETETEFSTEPVTENSAEPSAELTAGFTTDFTAENPTG